MARFSTTVCKTIRPMLSDCCPVLPVLSVCDVGVLWPNGWMDQDETWHAGRPWPWPHCVRCIPSCPSPKREQSPQLSAHICCGQMAGWIKMPLAMEIASAQATLCWMGTQFPLPLLQRGSRSPIFGPCILWPNGWMDQDDTWHGGGPRFRPHCAKWGPALPPPKGA